MVNFPLIHVRWTGSDYDVVGDVSKDLGAAIPRGEGCPDDGAFASWRWDGSSLVVRNDRYGKFPLFFAADDKQVAVSQSPLELIASGISPELDDEAIAVFLRVGFYLQEDTPFRAIRALPPNAMLRWTEGCLQLESHPPACTDLFPSGRDAAITEYIERFEAAIARRHPAPPHAVHMLTGGRDSRHILLELARQGALPDECLTVGSDPAAEGSDVAVARQLAQAVGAPHRALRPRLAPYGRFETRRNVLTHFTSDEGWWWEPMVAYADRTEMSCLYDGIGGDVLSAGLFQDERLMEACRSGRFEEVADHLLIRFGASEPSLAAVLTQDQRVRMGEDIARERIIAELRRHAGSPNPLAQFVFWNRTRREMGILQHSYPAAGAVYDPFLDHDVFDLLASLPAEMVVDHQFHNDTIARAYPEFAHIPYASSGFKSTRVQRLQGEFNLMAFVLLNRPAAFGSSLKWVGARLQGRRAGRKNTSAARLYYIRLLETVTGPPRAVRLLQEA